MSSAGSASGYDVEVAALVLRAPDRAMERETIRLRDVGPTDVRLRIDVTGVCHSDLSLARGVLAQPLPAVLGHEACATVVEIGAQVRELSVGQRVIPLWNTPCGVCHFCARGEAHLCEQGASRAAEPYAIDRHGTPIYPGLSVGSFAEQTVLPATGVVAVPDDIEAGDAALLGCAVTTGVGAVTKTTPVQAGSSVLVIGLGGVGLSAVQGARLRGAAPIIAVDRNVGKESHALAAGADHFVPADEGLKKVVRALTLGRGVDFAFDCVGAAATIRDAWSLTRRGGTTCVVGVGPKDQTVAFSPLELFYFARTLTGCVGGSLDVAADMPRYFDWVREGRLGLSALVTDHGDLDDIEPALVRMAAGDGVRTLIRPGG